MGIAFLKKLFSQLGAPAEDPKPWERDDDDTLTADIILQWAWSGRNGGRPDRADAQEFVQRNTMQGYKPASALSEEEKTAQTPAKKLISDALEDIISKGSLSADKGYRLQFFAETGGIYNGAVGEGKKAPTPQNP